MPGFNVNYRSKVSYLSACYSTILLRFLVIFSASFGLTQVASSGPGYSYQADQSHIENQVLLQFIFELDEAKDMLAGIQIQPNLARTTFDYGSLHHDLQLIRNGVMEYLRARRYQDHSLSVQPTLGDYVRKGAEPLSNRQMELPDIDFSACLYGQQGGCQ